MKRSLVLLSLVFGPFLAMLDSGIVNVGLPSMAHTFGQGLGGVQWVASVYLLVISLLLPFMGALSDRVGRKRIYTAGYLVLAVFTLFCGSAADLVSLIAFRALQAVGATMILSNGMALATSHTAPASRGQVLGILATSGALGSILGPAVGGWIIGVAGWPMVFWITGFVAIVGMLAGFGFLPHEPKRPVSQLPVNPWLWSKAIFGVDLFRIRSFRLSWTVALVGFFAFMTPTVLIPFSLQSAGLSPQSTGLAMMVFPLAMVLVSTWSGRWADRLGSRSVTLVGWALGLFGLVGLALAESRGLVAALIAYGVLGLAMGAFQASNNSTLMGSAPATSLGSAAAFTQLARNLGTSVAIAGSGGLFSWLHQAAPVYWMAAAVATLSLAIMITTSRERESMNTGAPNADD